MASNIKKNIKIISRGIWKEYHKQYQKEIKPYLKKKINIYGKKKNIQKKNNK